MKWLKIQCNTDCYNRQSFTMSAAAGVARCARGRQLATHINLCCIHLDLECLQAVLLAYVDYKLMSIHIFQRVKQILTPSHKSTNYQSIKSNQTKRAHKRQTTNRTQTHGTRLLEESKRVNNIIYNANAA